MEIRREELVVYTECLRKIGQDFLINMDFVMNSYSSRINFRFLGRFFGVHFNSEK